MIKKRLFTKILMMLFLAAQMGCVRFIILHDTLTAEEHNDLGVAYLKEKEFEAAEKEFKRAIKKDRYYWLAYYNIGTLYLQINKEKEAEHYFYKAIVYNHECADAYNNLALTELKQDDIRHAFYFIKLALEYAKEGRYRYLDTLATIYEKESNHEEACKALHASSEAAPETEKEAYQSRYKQKCTKLFSND
ncbi:MAG: hypothetical protein A2Y62_06995 [Candidatus Fischerbacteria bacterium RBG_13_37_8]|uniref:Uncharacterized protein n=1 Tax=Candidatus Fischerbacteria bacterium RBG_13_37_8 TaxID=1817863 RepID=A0A1F5V6Y6_9BACT|nr:MAG: hypothetical protein A2Y62_06995 [Candidatus Fischerbacteria bacterium RBG_13_37_8]